jgi:hypothetical protein
MSAALPAKPFSSAPLRVHQRRRRPAHTRRAGRASGRGLAACLEDRDLCLWRPNLSVGARLLPSERAVASTHMSNEAAALPLAWGRVQSRGVSWIRPNLRSGESARGNPCGLEAWQSLRNALAFDTRADQDCSEPHCLCRRRCLETIQIRDRAQFRTSLPSAPWIQGFEPESGATPSLAVIHHKARLHLSWGSASPGVDDLDLASDFASAPFAFLARTAQVLPGTSRFRSVAIAASA